MPNLDDISYVQHGEEEQQAGDHERSGYQQQAFVDAVCQHTPEQSDDDSRYACDRSSQTQQELGTAEIKYQHALADDQQLSGANGGERTKPETPVLRRGERGEDGRPCRVFGDRCLRGIAGGFDFACQTSRIGVSICQF